MKRPKKFISQSKISQGEKFHLGMRLLGNCRARHKRNERRNSPKVFEFSIGFPPSLAGAAKGGQFKKVHSEANL
jgi:hypothetical protein